MSKYLFIHENHLNNPLSCWFQKGCHWIQSHDPNLYPPSLFCGIHITYEIETTGLGGRHNYDRSCSTWCEWIVVSVFEKFGWRWYLYRDGGLLFRVTFSYVLFIFGDIILFDFLNFCLECIILWELFTLLNGYG